MKRLFIVTAAIVGAFAVNACSAPADNASAITITDAMVRPAMPGQTTAMGMVTINNSGPADVLFSVSSPISQRIELHTHIIDGEVMKMRRVAMISVRANSVVELKSGGDHVMIFNANIPEGAQSVPLIFNFQTAGNIETQAMIIGAGKMDHSGH